MYAHQRKPNRFLPALMWAAALVLLAYGSYRLFFCIFTSSDALIEEVWSRAILTRGLSAWYELTFTFSPAWFPDFFGHLLAKSLGLAPVSTAYMATLFQVAVALLSALTIYRALDRREHGYTLWAVLLTAFCTLLAARFPGMWLWRYSMNDNLSATILGFFALALSIVYLKNPRPRNMVVLFALVTFAEANGKLFLLTYLAPALFSSGMLLLLYWVKTRRLPLMSPVTKLMIGIFLAFLFSELVFEPWINPFSTAHSKIGAGMGILQSAHNFVTSVSIVLTQSGWLVSALTVLWVILLGKVVLLCLRYTYPLVFPLRSTAMVALPPVQPFLYLFLLAAIGANLLGPIAAGQIYSTLPSYRYFSTLFSLPILLLPVLGLAGATAEARIRILKNANLLLVLGCTGLALIVYHTPHRTVDEVLQTTPFTAEAVASACVDAHADSEHLHYGVSDYWHSYPLGFLSHKNIWINPVCNTLEPCVALDRHLYQQPPGATENPIYNFVYISNDAQFDFNEKKLKPVLPPPDRTVSCPKDGVLYIYRKPSSITAFNQLLQQQWQPFFLSNGAVKSVTVAPGQWIRLNGDWGRVAAPTITEKTPVGWAYGALRVPLSKGTYRAHITFTVTGAPDRPLVAVGFGDAAVPFNPNLHSFADQGLEFGAAHQPQSFTLEFTVKRRKSQHPWGFWTFNYGGGTMVVHSAELTRIK